MRGAHECEPWQQAAYEASLLHEQVELLQFEVDEFLRSSQGRARLAFAHWCREHDRC